MFSFWKWRRNAKKLYVTEVTLVHQDGTPVVLTIQSASAEHAATIANSLRRRFSAGAPPAGRDPWNDFAANCLKELKETTK